jgi:hypothetical protein
MTQTTQQDREPKEQRFVGMPKKITKLIEGESDRGTILILAAYLEEILGLIVNAACVSDDDGDKILEFRGPAGGFELKTQLCKALALIHPEEANGLQAVRKVRNAAAHFDTKRGFDVLFDSQPTADQVANLAESQNLRMLSREPKAVRELFVVSVRLLANKLYWRLLDVERPQPVVTLKQTANEIRDRLKDTEIGKKIAEIEAEARSGNPEAMYELIKAMSEAITEHLAAGGAPRKTE